MKIRFWGVRGSIPVPGAGSSVWGGNSSCVEVEAADGSSLMLDGGTGARLCGQSLLQRRVRHVHVLFTHFHTDHIFGFPFFGPIYAPSCSVDVGIPAFGSSELHNPLARYMNGVFHPVRLSDLGDRVVCRNVRPNSVFEMGPFRVTGTVMNHPGGAMGYRVEVDGQVMTYLTDTAPLARPDEGLMAGYGPPLLEQRVMELLKASDLAIFDTMFSRDEYLEKMTWGHAYPEYALRLAQEADVRRLALFHHSPEATDAELDRLDAHWRGAEGPVSVFCAKEGEAVDLEG